MERRGFFGSFESDLCGGAGFLRLPIFGPCPTGGPGIVIGMVDVEGKGGRGADGTDTGVGIPVVAGKTFGGFVAAGLITTGCVVDKVGAEGST